MTSATSYWNRTRTHTIVGGNSKYYFKDARQNHSLIFVSRVSVILYANFSNFCHKKRHNMSFRMSHQTPDWTFLRNSTAKTNAEESVGTRRGARNQKLPVKICQKYFATTWWTRFFNQFISPLRGKHVFFKKLWGFSPTLPLLAPPLVGTPYIFHFSTSPLSKECFKNSFSHTTSSIEKQCSPISR
jgi:hypothetical protein